MDYRGPCDRYDPLTHSLLAPNPYSLCVLTIPGASEAEARSRA